MSVISNPLRYHSRYRLYNHFAKHIESFDGVKLYTVEAAFGDRDFEVTQKNNPQHIQVRNSDPIWLKENLMNIGISRLPDDWQYVAIVDADVQFLHPHWVHETIHSLQAHPVVQMFESVTNLGPTGKVLSVHQGFAYSYFHNIPYPVKDKNGKLYGPYLHHPGFAWAWTREALDDVGGLIDKSILGAGDHHMALALIGQAAKSLPGSATPEYNAMIMEWENKATEHIKGNVGYVDGSISHSFHGSFENRRI